jgi:glycosyltransferase involved in cell wall biosynthesis
MKKKILVVSPTPTHPAIAGNRKRIFTMLKSLQEMGCEITFVLDDQEGSGGHTATLPDYEGMSREWDSFCRVQDFEVPAGKQGSFVFRLLRTTGAFLKNHFYFLYELLAPLWLSLRNVIHMETDSGETLDRRPSSIDCRYNSALTGVLNDLYRVEKFDAMLVEYVFMSRALLGFPGSPGVIDTHDVFSDRTKRLKKKQVKNTFFNTSSDQEGKGLNRADAVIAIQDEEADFFRSISSTEVVTVGHLTPYIGVGQFSGEGKNILFVGAGNVENIEGINDFVDSVFTPLVAERSGYNLYVAGNVGKYLNHSLDEIVCMGEIDNLADAYKLADLTVSPINVGTGLKIKIIESFAYGVPVIGTVHSMTGVPEIFRDCYIAVNNNEDFREAVESTLDDPARLKKMHDACRNAVAEYRELNNQNLWKIFFR